MSNQNECNIQYFEAKSMRGLFDLIQEWEDENDKRTLSLSVEKDKGFFCCIALTSVDPREVLIFGIHHDDDTLEFEPLGIKVDDEGHLLVKSS